MPTSTSRASTLTATSRQVSIGGHDLYTLTLLPRDLAAEEEPWLVFLHEGLGCTAMWHDFPHRLVQLTRKPALVYDRQGYGRSGPRPQPPGIDYLHREAETLLPALLDHFGIETPVLIGHSDGGTIALLYAARFPQRVTGVIAEAAHVLVEAVTLEGIRATVEAFQKGDLNARLARYHGEHTREMFYYWADIWLSEAFQGWNIEACLPNIRCDVLVLQGLSDRYGTVRQAKAMAEGIGSRARQCLIRSCGHAPHREAPRRTLAAMRQFILNSQGALGPGKENSDDSC